MVNMLQKQEICAIIEQFYFGEADGAKLIHELPSFAPSQHEKEFCRYWQADEEKHERLFACIVEEYNIKKKGFNPLLDGIFRIAWQCVKEKDWVKCMVISAVIENIALEAGKYVHENSDETVQRILDQILPDEEKHLGFSNQQLRKYNNKGNNKNKIKDVIKQVKMLSFTLGRQNMFNKHDISVANRAEKNLLNDLKHIDIDYPHIENKNGFVRNSVLYGSVLLI